MPSSNVLLDRLRGLADPALRRRTMARALDGDPDQIARAAADLIARAAGDGHDPELAVALACLAHAVGDVGYEVRQALYVAARASGADAFARLLIDASPATADDAQVARQMQPERALKARGRPLTLGERKALARSPRRELLLHLLRDPHPDVVRILLDNPRLTERDAVAQAAARPAVPAALTAIAEHPRWSARHIVRRAVVLNPHTPVHVAVRLATTLSPADWREIAHDLHLSDALRHHAAELLRGRPSPVRLPSSPCGE